FGGRSMSHVSTLFRIGRWQTGRYTQHIRAAGYARLPYSQDATFGADRLRLSAPHFGGVAA
ncbi:hypothetical protein KHT87_22820, partial [Alkalihalobacillus clausii]|uniref:hypothetical protein n=1 Tax=Shouchella clausii TaxID=79880 RepID=UPI001C0C680C